MQRPLAQGPPARQNQSQGFRALPDPPPTLPEASGQARRARWGSGYSGAPRCPSPAPSAPRVKDPMAAGDDCGHIRFFSFSLIEGYISLVMDVQTQQR